MFLFAIACSLARADEGSTPFTLYAGVSHSAFLPHVATVLKPHIAKRPVAKPHKTEMPPTTAKPHKAETAPLPEKAEVAAPASPPKPSLKPQAPTTAPIKEEKISSTVDASAPTGYLPAFGVARLASATPVEAPAKSQPVSPHYTTEWFMIPRWMAGVWVKEGDLTTQVVDLRTGLKGTEAEWTPNKMQTSWGHQVDSAGNVWHVNFVPYERDGVSAGKNVRFLTVAQHCEQSSPSVLVTRTHYVVSESSALNNQPVDTFQQESLNHYMLDNNSELVNSNSTRVFTYQGLPVRDGHLESKHHKIGDFRPVASIGGIDLRSSLNDYLNCHGMSHLKH